MIDAINNARCAALRSLLLVTTAVILLSVSFSSCKKSNDGDFSLVMLDSGLNRPVGIVHPGDNRLFVVEQPGTIVMLDSAGKIIPGKFLNITDRVVFGGERGLLGLAFHPDYPINGYFYINYIGEGDSTHISRFCTISDNPDKADSLSEVKLLSLKQPYENHNGGNIAFGPDGYLYIGLGDGGSQGDPENRAQNPKSLLGKILRIDVNGGTGYSVPDDNPFVNDNAFMGEIWSLGLRNPWRFSFDKLNGDIWIADVGQNNREEINMQPGSSSGGENYGWRCYEGNDAYNLEKCDTASILTVFPVHTYPHGPECSVTGGYVYRGGENSLYFGKYFFADYCSDIIWTLTFNAGRWESEVLGQFPGNNFSTFGEDMDGNLYVAGHESGIIYRLTL